MFKNDFSFMLPVNRKNIALANECIKCLLEIPNIPIVVIDENGNDSEYINDSRIKFVHNKTQQRPALTQLWNQCIKECPTEYPITVAWRSRPTINDIQTIDNKISEGFALVALQDLHFFCFGKHITTIIGWHDTGFKSGQWEDCDIWNRFFVNDLAIYASHELKEISYPTCWADGSINGAYYRRKWNDSQPPYLIQLKNEENYEDRNIYKGVFKDREYLKFDKSQILAPNLQGYFTKYNKRNI